MTCGPWVSSVTPTVAPTSTKATVVAPILHSNGFKTIRSCLERSYLFPRGQSPGPFFPDVSILDEK